MKLKDFVFRIWSDKNKEFLYQDEVLLGVEDEEDSFKNGMLSFTNEDYEIEFYTNLKDRIGKGIYAGDIVEVKFDENGENETLKVVFKNGHFGLKSIDDASYLMELSYIDIKVIGNIHENPNIGKE